MVSFEIISYHTLFLCDIHIHSSSLLLLLRQFKYLHVSVAWMEIQYVMNCVIMSICKALCEGPPCIYIMVAALGYVPTYF